MTDKLQAIREACIKANPEIKGFCGIHAIMYGATSRNERETCKNCAKSGRPIRLADVLLAIRDEGWNPEISVNTDGRLHVFILNRGTVYYNLRSDDLSLQSTETIDFLYELLTKQ